MKILIIRHAEPYYPTDSLTEKVRERSIDNINNSEQKHDLKHERHKRQHRAIFCPFEKLCLLCGKCLSVVMIFDLQHIHLGLDLYHKDRVFVYPDRDR